MVVANGPTMEVVEMVEVVVAVELVFVAIVYYYFNELFILI